MTRRTVLLIVAAVALLGAGGWWLATHFERVPVKKTQPPGPEALHNRYLALERFLSKMGRPMANTGDVRALDKLAPGGALILDRNRRALMTKSRLDALFKWVGNGGYLIVVPESAKMPDPILDALHVKWGEACGCSKPKRNSPQAALPASAVAGASGVAPASAVLDAFSLAGASAAAAASAPAASAVVAGSGVAAASAAQAASAPAAGEPDDEAEDDPPRAVVHIPGTVRPLEISPQYTRLKAGDLEPEWRLAQEGENDQILHYRYGMGNITLVVGLDQIVSNYFIGQMDHAEFIWTLLQRYQPRGPVTLMTRYPVPNLFDWLKEYAWAALISAALLIALWLWHVIPRFGAPAPDAPPSRRELREHLNAVGRFVWRTQGYGRWLEVARTAFRERLGMRHPAIAAMDAPAQAEALAKLTSRPREPILSALAGTPNSASEFTAMLRMLKNLKHDL